MVSNRDCIYINGESSDKYDIYIDTPPVPPMAIKRGTLYKVGGESDIFAEENGYENITVKIRAYSFYRPDFDNTEFNWWLNGAKTLQTSRFSKFFYKVLRVSVVSSSQIADGEKIKYEISFLCEPFKYFADNPEIKLEVLTTVENNGKIFCRPIYNFTISGNFAIDVNGEIFTVYNDKESRNVTIDCENMMVYDDDKSFLRNSGYFPLLNVGTNKIKIAGANSGKVKMNARC